jgi:hypothetical protein
MALPSSLLLRRPCHHFSIRTLPRCPLHPCLRCLRRHHRRRLLPPPPFLLFMSAELLPRPRPRPPLPLLLQETTVKGFSSTCSWGKISWHCC